MRNDAKTQPFSLAPPLTPRHPTAKQDNLRAKAQAAFLAAYEQIGGITKAADRVGINRESHYRWLESDPDYAEKWDRAQQVVDEALLCEAIRRGRDGITRGIYYQGVKVDTEINYSDNLLMFMIKGRMPQFKDRMELTGANGGPLQVQAVRPDSLSRLTDAQLDALAQLNGLAPLALTAVATTSQDEPQDIDAHAVDEDVDGAEGHAQGPTTLPAPDTGASLLDALDSPAEPGDEPGE
jgi:hypothetical protein